MKYKLLLISIFTFFSTLIFSQNEFEIKVTVNKNYVGNYLQVNHSEGDVYPSKIADTVFYIKGKCREQFELVNLRLQQSDAFSYLKFFITNSKMELKINHLYSKDTLYNIEFKNFPFNTEQKEYLYETYKDYIRGVIFRTNFIDVLPHTSEYGHLRDSLSDIHQLFLKSNQLNTLGFIFKHPNSFLSFYKFCSDIASSSFLTPDSLRYVFSLFNQEYKLSKKAKETDSIITEKQRLFSFNKIGVHFKEFKFHTNMDSAYQLSNLTKNGYVLLCYWASWCGPCRRNIPKLKKIYNSFYNKGLQLISLSIDDSETKWKQALEAEQMPWLQTCDINKYIQQFRMRDLLYISAVPQYFLLNNQGVIVYNNLLSKDDENYSKLIAILNNL